MGAIPERLRNVSCGGAIKIDSFYLYGPLSLQFPLLRNHGRNAVDANANAPDASDARNAKTKRRHRTLDAPPPLSFVFWNVTSCQGMLVAFFCYTSDYIADVEDVDTDFGWRNFFFNGMKKGKFILLLQTYHNSY